MSPLVVLGGTHDLYLLAVLFICGLCMNITLLCGKSERWHFASLCVILRRTRVLCLLVLLLCEDKSGSYFSVANLEGGILYLYAWF